MTARTAWQKFFAVCVQAAAKPPGTADTDFREHLAGLQRLAAANADALDVADRILLDAAGLWLERDNRDAQVLLRAAIAVAVERARARAAAWKDAAGVGEAVPVPWYSEDLMG